MYFSVIEWFDKIADQYPDRIAIKCGTVSVSFKVLQHRSKQVAYALQQHHIRVNDLIGIALNPGIHLVEGVLGILRTGAAYVPLDPELPITRINAMIAHASISLIVTENQFAPLFSHQTLLFLDTENFSESSYTPPPFYDRAYILYTSGSTGTPKGVIGKHSNLVFYLHTFVHDFLLSAKVRLPLISSVNFASALSQLFPSLLLGNTLHIPLSNLKKSPEDLLKWYAEHPHLGLYCVPSLWERILDTQLTKGIPKQVLLSGEPLTQSLSNRTFSFFPDIQLWNFFGPTEATSNISYSRVMPGETVTIGKPIAKTALYLLDSHLQPVPTGSKGEIYCNGPGLTEGYLNAPATTALAFLPDPFMPGRMYKTGDLAELCENGSFRFLGRSDHQVKIRGFRVELEEIEFHLNLFPGLRKAIVMEKDGQLKAYVIPIHSVTYEDLFTFLMNRLPDYMIPSSLYCIKAFHYLPNGKIDRKYLAEEKLVHRNKINTPQNTIESTLMSIWQSVMKKDHISPDDHFFALGGHSLLMAKIIALIKEKLNISIDFKIFFKYPRLHELAQYIQTSTESPLPPRSESTSPTHLTFAEKRFWFLEHLYPGLGLYTITYAFKVEGRLDIQRLQSALNQLMQRHPLLRSQITHTHFDPLPPETVFPLEISDTVDALGSIPSFKLSEGPLCHSLVIQQDPDSWILRFAFHHIIFDDSSMEIFCRELGLHYNNYTLAPVARQFPIEDTQETSLLYWVKILQDAPFFSIPYDYPEQDIRDLQGDSIVLPFPSILSKSVFDFSTEVQTTLFLTLLSLLKIFLSLITGKNDIIIGTPVSTRPLSGLDDVVGLFVNTIPLRTNLQNCTSLIDVVQSVQKTFFESMTYKNVPFDLIVNRLGGKRSQKHHPIFQIFFALEYTSNISLSGLLITPQRLASRLSRFDLSFIFLCDRGQLSLCIEYPKNLYQKKHMEVLAAQCLHDFSRWIHKPTASLKPQNSWIHEQFERFASLFPDHIALIHDGTKITYHALHIKVDQVAGWLQHLGVGPEIVVALCLPKGISFIIYLLAILKCGGVYFPLEKEMPLERAAYMLDKVKASLLITDSSFRLSILPYFNTEIYTPDQSEVYPFSPIAFSQDCLAYVLFTSGSTGKPKPVGVSYGSLINCLQWQQDYFALQPDDAILHKTSIGFDVSIGELLWSFVAGATLVISSYTLHKEPEKVVSLISTQKITILHLVPTALISLLAAGVNFYTTSLRLVLCNGESLPSSLYKTVFVKHPHISLYNLYGPTEATIHVSYFPVNTMLSAPVTPLGKAIRSVELLILDAHLNEIPTETAGELYIGGISLARGYIGEPALTAERFIPHPWREGERLYRTGDLAKKLSDGNIAFLGRNDDQCKIRGYRIELNEIETVLIEIPGINKAAVIANQEEMRIEAFIETDHDRFSHQIMSETLKKRLPEYMIPSAFHIVPSLPLLNNGKIDRATLRKISHTKTSNIPNTSLSGVEKILFNLWEKILSIKTITIEDNFFEVGGHSLLLISLKTEIENHFACSISLLDLFAHPSIKAQSQFLQKTLAPHSVAKKLNPRVRLQLLSFQRFKNHTQRKK